ncbi:MAG: diaminopropionate ammonia-lyase [Coriobacteriales bacterium]|nr:diaminopropionate ammonia-lyase [Coriobacteriales bacterium]
MSMRERIKWAANEQAAARREVSSQAAAASLSLLTTEQVARVSTFHASIPEYEPTPLVRLDGLAAQLGLKSLYVKDESYRFGLNAFKVLGGSYAVARHIAERLGRDIAELPYAELVSPATRAAVGQITFYSATDGNHGRGVAWAANRLGQKSVICMPVGSSQIRLENIRSEGATATITDMNYDEAVLYVKELAENDPNGVVVQDTDWPGYTQIPGWIMQGYATLAAEADMQLHADGVSCPTHVFVQAGVGAFAGAVQGYFANAYGEDCPITTVVEAAAYDCLFRSVLAGELVAASGEWDTIMAGLACGEGCGVSWEVLHEKARFFTSAPDWVSARGMRMLAAPPAGDAPVKSGESGAVGVGLVATLMLEDEYHKLREAMGLGADSVVLCVSTEGDTDPQRYRDIVWDGYCPSGNWD